MMMKSRQSLLLCAIFLLAAASPVFADDMGPIDAVIKSFETVLVDGSLEDTLIGGAKFLFYCLAIIQLSWMVGMELLCGAGTMQSVIACIVRQSMHIAFFYLLLVPTALVGSNNILGVIVHGVQQLGVKVSGVSDFSSVFSVGIRLSALLWQLIQGSVSLLALGSAVGAYLVGGLCTVIILLSFSLASLTVVLALCRTYVSTSITVFYLGFGGCSYTKDIALNALRAAFIAGMELFTLYVLASVGTTLFERVLTMLGTVTSENIFTATFSLTAAAVIFAGLLRWLPGYVSGIINGSSGSVGGGASLMGTLGAAALIASAGGATLGGMAGAAVGGFHGSAAGGGAGGLGSILKGAASGMYSGSKGGFQQMFRNAGMDSLRGPQVKPPSEGMPGMPDFNNITGTPSSSDGGGAQPSSPSDSAGSPTQTNDAGLNQRVDVPQEDGDKKA